MIDNAMAADAGPPVRAVAAGWMQDVNAHLESMSAIPGGTGGSAVLALLGALVAEVATLKARLDDTEASVDNIAHNMMAEPEPDPRLEQKLRGRSKGASSVCAIL